MMAPNEQLAADLTAALAKIEKPEAWTKGFFARDQYGERVFAVSDAAVCWCGDGAIFSLSLNFHRERDALEALCAAAPAATHYFPKFNDAPKTTHADVVDVFKRAIANAGGVA